jgi:hypothetical protein
MYDNELNPVKGWWHEHAVDKAAPLASGETITAGSVCYLDSNGDFRLGLPDNTVGCFAFPNSGDFDVSADVGNIQEQVMMGLPCVASYELQSTYFDSSYTYAPNDYLTAWDSQLDGYAAADKGKIRPGTPYTHTLVGVITEGSVENEHGVDMITFWTYHLPVNLTGTSSATA